LIYRRFKQVLAKANMKIATVAKVNDSSYELDDGSIINCHSKPLVEIDDSVCVHDTSKKILVFIKPDNETTRRVIMNHADYGLPESSKQKIWDRLEEYVERIFNSTPDNENKVTVSNFINSQFWKSYRHKAGLNDFIVAVGEDVLGTGKSKDKSNCVDLKKFVREWINRRIFRQFYLWGLTKKEAIECADSLLGSKRPTIEYLVEKMFEYPERFSFLPEAKINNLEMIFGYKADVQRTYRKIFLRQLWNAVGTGHSFKNINKMEFLALKNGLDSETISSVKPVEQIEEAYGIKFLDLPYFPESNPSVRVMPISIYRMETYVLDMLSKKIARCPEQDSWLKRDFAQFDPELSEDQRNAVKMALQCPISNVTGGPGTGKTRIIKEIINQLNAREMKYYATSFTGKAVARIKEVCQPMQINAATIDKMVAKGADKISFRYLIVDESSMVTTQHLYRLFTTFHPLGYSIIFIGDLDQLPPIGWGHIFDSLIWSQRVPIKRLVHNYRVNSVLGKEIITNSQKIVDHTRNLGMSHLIQFDLSSPSFCLGNGNIKLLEKILTQLRDKINSSTDGDDKRITVDDITVLTPYNEAITDINPLFQSVFMKTLKLDFEKSLTTKYGKRWFVGDRVMNLENCYLTADVGVMNGQIGKIIQIINQDIVVEFPNYNYDPTAPTDDETDQRGKPFLELTYYYTAPKQFVDLMEGITPESLEIDKHLSLAYAMSIHKSQGSEYPFSIIYLPDHKANKHFLSVNMLYTAITRAKQCAWVIYDGKTSLIYALSRRSVKTRNTVEESLKKTFFDRKYTDGLDFESIDMDVYGGNDEYDDDVMDYFDD
jgi:hypothetical protein